MKDLQDRIDKGIEYFDGIKPSKWNLGHTTHLKILLGLMTKYMKYDRQNVHKVHNVQPESEGSEHSVDTVEIAEEVFGNGKTGGDA